MGTSTVRPSWGQLLGGGAKVLPSHARSHNRAMVLQTLVSHSVLSRADIARRTGLTRVTVSDLVADLIEDSLVVELGPSLAARPGKPATLLKLDPDAFHVVGVDLSDLATFRAAVLDLEGQPQAIETLSVTGARGEDAVTKVLEVTRRALDQSTVPVLGIGVGTPGVVDAEGTVLTAPNLDWRDVGLQDHLAAQLELPVYVANDANAAVMAERSFGGGESDLLLVKVGSGVGAGVLLDGTPRLGSRFAAGEIGHVVVGTDGGPPCACGKNGCLEAWLGLPNLRSALAEAGSETKRRAVLEEAGARLGIALAPVIGTLNIADIALAGPVDLLTDDLLDAALATVRARMLAQFYDSLDIRMATLGADIVLRGAAALVLAAQLGLT